MPSYGEFIMPPPARGGTVLIACGQAEVLGDGCPVCGGWLYADKPDGTPGSPVPIVGGWTVCSTPECAEAERERLADMALPGACQ